MPQPFDIVVRGGTVVRPRELPFAADVAIHDGRIAALAAPETALEGERVIDASGLHIMPGAVDPHAHIGMGGGMDEYGPDSGAAALGGVTTIFYILMQPGPYGPIVREHLDASAGRCWTDHAYHLTLMTDEHAEELPQLWGEFGISSFKYFMSFRGQEGAYLGVSGTDDGAFMMLMHAVAEQGGVLMVHPENIEIVWRLRERLMASGRDDLRAWNESRPPLTEAESIGRAAFLAGQKGCPLYFVHVSSALALQELKVAQQRFPGAVLYGETCPHFLTHTEASPVGTLGKVNPPLRTESDVEALWAALEVGALDTVGSDHVGRRRAAKDGTIWTASAGFPGLPVTLPVLLSEGHRKGRLSLSRIAHLTAARPAEIFGLAGRKGDIAVGLDADLAIVDLDWEREPAAEWLGTWSDYSLYEGWPLRGWPRYTLVRGTVVQEEGVLVGKPAGRYVSRRSHTDVGV